MTLGSCIFYFPSSTLKSQFSDIFVALTLLSLFPSCNSASTSCRLQSLQLVGASEEGDLLVSAVLPIHIDKESLKNNFTHFPLQGECRMYSLDVFQQIQVLRFTIREINRNTQLLPNLTLGFQVYDSCCGLHHDLEGTLKITTGQDPGIPNFSCHKWLHVPAIIGHTISTFSILNAHILGLYRFPQISHYSTSSLLSDKKQFPSFFRTVPSDTFQSKGLAQLVIHFGWTWVGLVAVGEDYGQQGIEIIKEELLQAGACVAFIVYVYINRPEGIPHVAKIIKESTAKVIVAFMTDVEMFLLVDEMEKQNVNGKIFVASEAWSTSYLLSLKKYSAILSGTIGFSYLSSSIPGLEKFLRNIHLRKHSEHIWMKEFWEEVFGCRVLDQEDGTKGPTNNSCTGNEDPELSSNFFYDVSNLRGSYNLYMAIYVLAEAVHNMQNFPIQSDLFNDRGYINLNTFEPWQLSYYIKNVRFALGNGREMFFDKNGDPPAQYDIVNWQQDSNGELHQVKVGYYDTTNAEEGRFLINTSAIIWSNGLNQVPPSVCTPSCPPGFRRLVREDAPVCCFLCVSCPTGEVSNQTDSLDCFRCPWNEWPNPEKDKCLSKPRDFLSFQEPLGATLATLGALSSMILFSVFGLFIQFRKTPIVRANNYLVSCLLLVTLSLCFLSSLIFIGSPQPERCFIRQPIFGVIFAICISCILAKTIMVIFAFIATKPESSLRKWVRPEVSYMIIVLSTAVQLLLCISWVLLAPPFPTDNLQSQPGVIVVECNEGSKTAFWSMLGYLFFLASISFIVAFFARRLPDSFNEAKFITFSMLAFLTVWVSFIPAHLSSSGKYTVAMEIFAIQSSTWTLVICMFLPKCFIILFRPQLNTKGNLIGKTKF